MELRDLGEAAWTARDFYPCAFGRPDRRTLADHVQRLRDVDGLSVAEIAARCGISRSYTSSLYSDPFGDADRERKKRYSGTCERCGDPTSGSDGRANAPKLCIKCAVARLHADRYWTRDRIIEQLRLAAAILGRSPATSDYGMSPSLRGRMSAERRAEADVLQAAIRDGRVRRLHPSDVSRECGSWDAALYDAGLPSAISGALSHRGGKSATAHLRLVPPLTDRLSA